jgi:CRP-like cAMP-binding protein
MPRLFGEIIMKINHEPLPLMEPDKVHVILNKISLLGGLNEAQLETIFGELRTLSYKKDDIIFKQDSQPTFIYIVLNGRVKTFSDYKGTRLELLVMEPGQCFGETSLIGIQPHSVTAVAMENCEVLVLSSESLQTLFEKDMELYSMLVLNIARETSRNLRNYREHFIEYAMTHQQVTS